MRNGCHTAVPGVGRGTAATLSAMLLAARNAESRGPVGVMIWMCGTNEPLDITFCRADTL